MRQTNYLLDVIQSNKSTVPVTNDALTEWANDLIKCLSDSFCNEQIARILLNASEIPEDFLVKILNMALHRHKQYAKEICFALGWLGTSKSIRVLLNALDSTDTNIRKFAVFILGEIGTDTDAFAVIKMIMDTDVSVREMSAFSIGWNQGDFRVNIMRELLQNHVSYDRKAVRLALDMIGSQSAMMLQQELFGDYVKRT